MICWIPTLALRKRLIMDLVWNQCYQLTCGVTMVICEVLVKKDDNLKEMCRVGWEQQVCPTPPTPVETARLIFPGQPTTNLSDPRFSHMLSAFSQQLQEDWGKGILRYFLQQWYLEVWICFIFVSKSRTEIVSELNSIFHISGVAKF